MRGIIKSLLVNLEGSKDLMNSAIIALRNHKISLLQSRLRSQWLADLNNDMGKKFSFFIQDPVCKFNSISELYSYYFSVFEAYGDQSFRNFIDIPFDEVVSESEITLCAYLEVASKDLPISRSDEIQEGVFPPDIFHNLFALLTVKVAFSNNS